MPPFDPLLAPEELNPENPTYEEDVFVFEERFWLYKKETVFFRTLLSAKFLGIEEKYGGAIVWVSCKTREFQKVIDGVLKKNKEKKILLKIDVEVYGLSQEQQVFDIDDEFLAVFNDAYEYPELVVKGTNKSLP